MAHSTAFRNAVVDAVGVNGGASWFSLHTGDPSTTGANELVGSARVQSNFPSASAGSSTNTGATIGVPAGQTITHWARWTASTAGSFYSGGALPATEVYGTAGTYTLTAQITQPAT